MTELPGTWSRSTLGELCDLYQPKTISREKMISNGKYEVYGANGVIGMYDEYNHEDSEILLSCRGNCGTVNVSNPKSWINGNAMVCRPKTSALLKNYLRYYLESVNFANVITGTAQQQITRESLSKVEISIPPIDEQHKIVKHLEDLLARLDFALADVKQAKLKTVHIRRSILHAAFTGNIDSYGKDEIKGLPADWELRKLSQCLEKLKSGKLAERGWSPQCFSHPAGNENTWGVLKTTAVQMGEYQPQYNKELPDSLSPKVGLEVNPGDFLVTTTGPRNRCGVICHVISTRRKLIFSGKILRFRANEDIVLPNWLLFILMSPEYQELLDGLKVGSSDSSVSIGNQQILDLVIPVPPIEAQLMIVQLLEVNLSSLEVSAALIDSMEKLSSGLRRSLLQAAFSGQLIKEVASV